MHMVLFGNFSKYKSKLKKKELNTNIEIATRRLLLLKIGRRQKLSRRRSLLARLRNIRIYFSLICTVQTKRKIQRKNTMTYLQT